ncbi:unnamed protein product [Cuscuta campestris]|uniref:Reverse transcriptase zinc-binding domain-containing protein n=1 Tax=Cuscuta campestris TaxID=132261 RepID=A0A484MRB7_9ASTE|nr:unnamed protein product [Cuscuta campestris]
MAWERLTVPKKFGGMGFRNFSAFNVSLLAKQGWRFLVTPDALVSRVYKARFWRIPVAPKVKVCIWRALRGVLPTMGTLNSRRVEIVDKCPLCGIDGETVDHLILRCPFTEEARSQVDSLGDLQVVCWTIWSIWKVRNDVVWNRRAPQPSSAHRLAIDMHKAWCDRFQAGQTEELTHTGTTDIVQQSPRNGSFGIAFNGPIQSTQDPAMAEIMACKEDALDGND